jgi:hypothetical protein
MGKGGGGGDAAAAEIAANEAAQAEIRRQFDITQGNLDPFLQAGTQALPAQQAQATLGGLDDFFNQLFGTTSGTTTAAPQFEQVLNPAFTSFNDEQARLQELIAGGTTTAPDGAGGPFGGFESIGDMGMARRLGISAPTTSTLNAQAQQAQNQLSALGGSPEQFLQQQVQPQFSGGGGLQQALGGLISERQRALQGQLAAGGLTRSGTALEEAAAIPTDLGFQIEQMLSGRTSALAGSGQNAAAQLGAFGADASSSLAGIQQQSGQAISSGILADQQARAQASQNFLNTAGTIGSIFFSDPALKENVEEIGETGGLKIVQWDWIEKTKGTMIEGCGTIGFMADEVKEVYPQHVYEFGGFMMIDYPALLDELEEAA